MRTVLEDLAAGRRRKTPLPSILNPDAHFSTPELLRLASGAPSPSREELEVLERARQIVEREPRDGPRATWVQREDREVLRRMAARALT